MTLSQIEQKYFPGLGGLTVYRDTIIRPHVDAEKYFEAISIAINACDSPYDRIYIASWLFRPTFQLRNDPAELILEDLLLDKAKSGVDTRVIVSTPRISFRNGAIPLSREWLFTELERLPFVDAIADIAKSNARTAMKLRAATIGGVQPLARRVMMDWGGEMARHQKFTVVYRHATKDMRAFVGGIDFTPVVIADEFHSTPDAWWHDVGVEMRGGAAWAMMEEFRTRWQEAYTLPTARFLLGTTISQFNPQVDPTPAPLPAPPVVLTPPPVPADGGYTNTSVRILRSYEPEKVLFQLRSYPWDTLPPGGIQEVYAALMCAINSAQTYIYVECQSLNPVSLFEQQYQEHTKLFPLFSDALKRGVKVIFVSGNRAAPGVPIAPSLDMSPEVEALILSGLSGGERANFASFAVGLTKVHSKLILVDDEFASIGSANFWDRCMTGKEVEINAAIMQEGGDQSLIADLRIRLWCGHLRIVNTPDVVSQLRSHASGFSIFRQSWGSPVTFNYPDSALIEIT